MEYRREDNIPTGLIAGMFGDSHSCRHVVIKILCRDREIRPYLYFYIAQVKPNSLLFPIDLYIENRFHEKPWIDLPHVFCITQPCQVTDPSPLSRADKLQHPP